MFDFMLFVSFICYLCRNAASCQLFNKRIFYYSSVAMFLCVSACARVFVRAYFPLYYSQL